MADEKKNETAIKIDEDLTDEVIAKLNEVSLDGIIDTYIRQIDSLASTLKFAIAILVLERRRISSELSKEFNEDLVLGKDGKEYYRYTGITKDNFAKFEKLRKRNEKAKHAFKIIPQSYFVSLISLYDAFLSSLMRYYYKKIPNLLKTSDKQFSYEEIVKFESIDSIRDYLIDKAVYETMKGSHADQIEAMGKIANIKLKEELSTSWKTFLEITERRNLFVHTGGIVSIQYIDTCKKHNVNIDDIVKDDELSVSSDYFNDAYECILEIGIILAQATWRKLFPSERNLADANINSVCYELLVEERYTLASRILDHAVEEFKKHASTEDYRLMLLINRAQAHKWSGNDEVAKKLIRDEDWSAKSNEYKLASAILTDDFSEAYRLMRVIGCSGRPSADDYRNWPLFRLIRKESQFSQVFHEVFGYDFNTMQDQYEIKMSIFDSFGSKSNARLSVNESANSEHLAETDGSSSLM